MDISEQTRRATNRTSTPEADAWAERELTPHQRRKDPDAWEGGNNPNVDRWPPTLTQPPIHNPELTRSYGDRNRPSHSEIAMELAYVWAKRGTCPRLQVGAVIMDERGRVLTSGYNGAPREQPHCCDEGVGCLLVNGRCERAVHAEANAIIQAATTGISIAGAHIYVTHRPCIACAKLIVQAQLASVTFAAEYQGDGLNEEVLRMFDNARVGVLGLAYAR